MARHKHHSSTADADASLEIASLIDVCFLLLIYFLITSTIVPRESDLGLQLPDPRHRPPDAAKIEPLHIHIAADGGIHTGSDPARRLMDTDASSRELPLLRQQLDLFASASRAADTLPLVRIEADDRATQQRVIDVLDTLAAARIRNVTFGDSAD